MGRTPENPVIIRRGPPAGEADWIGITVEGEIGQPENYLWGESYQGDLSDPKIREGVASFIARVDVQMGVKLRSGYYLKPDDVYAGRIDPDTDLTKRFALYVEESRRAGFSFKLNTDGLKTAEQLQQEHPEKYRQAFQQALSSLPDVPAKKPRRSGRSGDRKYKQLMESALAAGAIDAEDHIVFERPKPITLEDFRDRILSQIPVDQFVQKYEVTDPIAIETLRAFPTLCYFLGRVTDKPQTRDSRPDGIERDVWYLTEGSGMFGLKNAEDAVRWKGIAITHTTGAIRHMRHIARRLEHIAPEQRKQFQNAGFDFSEYDKYDPSALPDILTHSFLPSHSSRRGVDEHEWHHLHDDAHPDGTTSTTVENLLLNKFKAPQELWDLIRKVEAHSEHMIGEVAKRGYFNNILDGMLTYADWTFGQKTISVDERFPVMTTVRKDLDPKMLEAFRVAGKYFEQVFNEVLQTDILQELKDLKPEPWETQIRKAYCSPSGLTIQEVFPDYPATA